MKLHLLEHDPIDLSRTNITIWVEKKGHKATKTDVFNREELPLLDKFDWLMVMGGANMHGRKRKTHDCQEKKSLSPKHWLMARS